LFFIAYVFLFYEKERFIIDFHIPYGYNFKDIQTFA